MSKASDLIYKMTEAGGISTGFGIHQAPPDFIRWRNEDALQEVAKLMLGRSLRDSDYHRVDTVAALSSMARCIDSVSHQLKVKSPREFGPRYDDRKEEVLWAVLNIGKALGVNPREIRDDILSVEDNWLPILRDIKDILKDFLKSDYDKYRDMDDEVLDARRSSVSAFGATRGTERALGVFVKKWKRVKKDKKRAREGGYDPQKYQKRQTHRYLPNRDDSD